MSMKRKAIILAAGLGSRLYPATFSVNKQLLPIFDKPLIYYSLSCVMLAGIREILIITSPHDTDSFRRLLGDGSQWGLCIYYAEQPSPNGLAEAFIIGATFIAGGSCMMILGDNIFYGHNLSKLLIESSSSVVGATVFAYQVDDPSRYGVISFDEQNKPLCIEEKPENPRSNYAVTGLYFYDEQVTEFVKELKPSSRGELEITDLNELYLARGLLNIQIMGRGYVWLDAGTHASMLDAAQYVAMMEKRQGLKIACPEEIAYRQGWIDRQQLEKLAQPLLKSGYGNYLINLI